MTDLFDRLDALAAEATRGVSFPPIDEVADARRGRWRGALGAGGGAGKGRGDLDADGYSQDPSGPRRWYPPFGPHRGVPVRPMTALISGMAVIALVVLLLVLPGSPRSRPIQVSPATAPVHHGSGPSGAPTTSGPSVSPSPCPSPSHDIVPVASASALAQRVTGTWLLCTNEGSSPIGVIQGRVGLQVLGDGRWSNLTRTSDGELEAMAGWENVGTWTALLSPQGTPEVNFKTAESTESVETATFLAGPPMMDLNPSVVPDARSASYYVPTSQLVYPAPAVPLSAGPLADCSVPQTQAVTTPTQQAFLNHLLGRWLLCKTPSIFDTNEAGMLISADGTWTKLTRNGAGDLTSLAGPGNQGRWALVDTSSMNGPGSFQVNFVLHNGGTVITEPSFGAAPAIMLLSGVPSPDALYVPTTAPVVGAKA